MRDTPVFRKPGLGEGVVPGAGAESESGAKGEWSGRMLPKRRRSRLEPEPTQGWNRPGLVESRHRVPGPLERLVGRTRRPPVHRAPVKPFYGSSLDGVGTCDSARWMSSCTAARYSSLSSNSN